MNLHFLVLFAFATLATGAAAEVAKNPWVRFNPDSWAKLESTNEVEFGGQKSTVKSEIRTRLASKSDAAVTLEIEAGTEGQTTKLTREILLDADTLGPKPVAPPKYGNETITAAGRSFSCVTVEYRMVANEVTTDVKEWTSDEVPGGVVRSESLATTGPTRTRTVLQLLEFQAK